MNTKTLIVDGTNILMRSVKAAERSMRLSVEVEGEEVNTGPVLLFINLLSKYVRQVNPDRMVVCWDGGRSLYRTQIYARYKEERVDRVDEDEEERTPFLLAKEFLTLSGIHHIEQYGVEADDLVALTWQKHHIGDDVTILSGDKDFLQLVGPGPGGHTETVQIRPGGNPEVWTEDVVVEKMECHPIDIPNVMALTGDAGDGVPGIPGYGIKTAVKHLNQYGSLEALLASDEKRIQGQKDQALINRRLVSLRGLDYGPDAWVTPAPRFHPTRPEGLLWQPLMTWLDRFKMETTKERLLDGSLWYD